MNLTFQFAFFLFVCFHPISELRYILLCFVEFFNGFYVYILDAYFCRSYHSVQESRTVSVK
jgi:hypothetical protein